MKNKFLTLFAAATLALSMTGCDDSTDLNDPQSVRKLLTKQGIPFSPNQFVKFAAAGDTANMTLMIKATLEIDSPDDNGNNAVAIAANKGDMNTLNYLFANGAKANVRNGHGEPILDNAVSMGKKEVVTRIIDQLKKEGVDPQTMSSAVHLAAKTGNAEMLELLANAGIPLEVRAADGYMPIHLTVKEGNYDALMVLIKHGVDINAKCKEGYSVMDWATSSGYTRLLKEVKKAGGKLTPKGKKDLKIK